MSLMGKPPMPLPLAELCEAWDKPSTSWVDYFLKANDLKLLLTHPALHRDEILSLTLQYVEQMIALDKDIHNLAKRSQILSVASERLETETDLLYVRRKRELTWLCTMACFAAVDWAFDEMIQEQKSNIHLVHYLMENARSYLMEHEVFKHFIALLSSKFRLYVSNKFRIPVPAGRPQTNNPNTQEDKGILLANNNREAINQSRARCGEAAAELETMLLEGRKIEAPTVEMFLIPFLQSRERYLAVALLGPDLTVQNLPVADFQLPSRSIPQEELHNILRYELACYHFQLLNFAVVRKYLDDLTPLLPENSETFRLCVIDRDELNGYLIAVQRPPLPGRPQHTRPAIHEGMLMEDHTPQRKFWINRSLFLQQSRGALSPMTKAENFARDAMDGIHFFAPTAFHGLIQASKIRFVQAIARLIERIRDPIARTSVRALLYLISATVPNFQDIERVLVKKALPVEFAVRQAIHPSSSPEIPASAVDGSALYTVPGDPFWTMLTSFDVAELSRAISQLEAFHLPYLFKYPEILTEVLMQGKQNRLNAVLLAKLEQLASIKNLSKWSEFLNLVVTNTPVLQQRNDATIQEAVLAQTRSLNYQLQTSHCAVDEVTVNHHVNLIKQLLRKSSLPPNGQFMISAVAFLINVAQDDFVLSELTPAVKPPYFLLAQLLTAWKQVQGHAKEAKIQFTGNFATYFESNGFFSAASNSRQFENDRMNLLSFIKLLRDQEHLSLLISFLCHLYNRYLLTAKKPQLALEFQSKDLWRIDVELPATNVEYLDEALFTALSAGLRLNPMHAFWLRSLADYYYTKGATTNALGYYMETVCACMENELLPPFPDVLLDDLMWYRIRVCLTSSGHHTLAAIVAQLIVANSYRLDQYLVAANNIRTQSVLDTMETLAPLCFDHALVETLTDTFERIQMTTRTDAFVLASGQASLNMANSPEVMIAERSRRTVRLLRTIAAMTFRVYA